MKISDLNKIYGSGYYEALDLSRIAKKVVFLAYNRKNKPEQKAVNSKFVVITYPFNLTFQSLLKDSFKAVKMIISSIIFTWKIVKKHKIDLIRAENIVFWGITAYIIYKVTNKPYTLYIVGDEIEAIKQKYGVITLRMIQIALELVFSKIMANAKSISTNLVPVLQKAKRYNKNTYFLPTKININRFKCTKPALNEEKVRFMYIGRLDKEKGINTLIQALGNKKLEKQENWEIHIIGHGPLENEIKQLSKRNKKVKFIGPVKYEDVPKWYNKADVVIIPSTTEGMPAVILEALACQRIVISTKVGSIPLTLGNGKYGILIEPNKPNELTKAIIEVIRHKKKYREKTEKSRKRVKALMKLYEKNLLKTLR